MKITEIVEWMEDHEKRIKRIESQVNWKEPEELEDDIADHLAKFEEEGE